MKGATNELRKLHKQLRIGGGELWSRAVWWTGDRVGASAWGYSESDGCFCSEKAAEEMHVPL